VSETGGNSIFVDGTHGTGRSILQRVDQELWQIGYTCDV